MSGFVMTCPVAAMSFAVDSRLRVVAVCAGSGRERLVRGPEEPVADEDRYHE